MSSRNSRATSLLVVGACLIVPMGMYVDVQQQNEEILNALKESGTTQIGQSDLSPFVTQGGRGGPAVGIGPMLDSDASQVVNGGGSPIEIVRIEEDSVNLTTNDNSRKVIHVKVAETVWPVEQVAISSEFGWREAPCEECSSDHRGVDFVPGAGTNVFSIYQGIVTAAGWYGGYGNRVEVKHYVPNDDGVVEEWITLYAHLQDGSIPNNVYVGSVVNTGSVIGKVGSTGTSTGDHLHFELLIEGENVDPMPILGHYELVELTEEELREWSLNTNVPVMNPEVAE